LPYIVLEAAAAGKPLITTRVGGIPEIFGLQAGLLVQPDDPAVLADAIASRLDRPDETAWAAAALRERVAQAFTIGTMVDGVLAAYAEGLAARKSAAPAFRQFAPLR
jgi:glycosyltransferase involved in cell wall biosynthesis